MKDLYFILIIVSMIWLNVWDTKERKNIETQINQNHIELLQLINTEKQAEIAFLESLKKSRSNRIKKGDELK